MIVRSPPNSLMPVAKFEFLDFRSLPTQQRADGQRASATRASGDIRDVLGGSQSGNRSKMTTQVEKQYSVLDENWYIPLQVRDG